MPNHQYTNASDVRAFLTTFYEINCKLDTSYGPTFKVLSCKDDFEVEFLQADILELPASSLYDFSNKLKQELKKINLTHKLLYSGTTVSLLVPKNKKLDALYLDGNRVTL